MLRQQEQTIYVASLLHRQCFSTLAELPSLMVNYYSALSDGSLQSRKTNYFVALMSNKLAAQINIGRT